MKMKKNEEQNSGSRASMLNGFQTKSVSLVFALFLILRNVQRGATVDTSFRPGYHGSSAPKRKKSLSRKEKKWLKMTFKEVIFFSSTSGLFLTY